MSEFAVSPERPKVKVFISSLISGMEQVRAAAREAVTTLRHEPIIAEDFGAQQNSPQVACLTGLREADVVVLILGERYGAPQQSGLSATHEEYREAKARKPVIAFVQQPITPDADQAAFIREVQSWEGGLFRGGFSNAADLKIALTRALHDYELANAVGPVDEADLVKRAVSLLPRERHGYSSSSGNLNVAVAGAPKQSVLRPIEIESQDLADSIHQAALFGKHRLFDRSLGVESGVQDDSLFLQQEQGKYRIALNEQGSVVIALPVREGKGMLPELIYEFVQEQLTGALGFTSWLLDRIDPTQKLTHVAVAASLSNADHLTWRSRSESEDNPNRISMGIGTGERKPVHLSRPRPALRLDLARLVEDLIVPLRRQWR